MGRIYSASVEEVALVTATDLMRIVAPSDAIVVLTSVIVTFDASAADTAIIEIFKGTGGGTAAVTPEKAEASDTAFGGTVHDLTGTTNVTKTAGNWVREEIDVRAGFYWQPSPKQYLTLAPSGICSIRSDIDITSANCSVTAWFEEIG